MTAMRDPDRLIRAFLDEGLTELPDRSYDVVRARVERARQRTVIGPWRTLPMPGLFRPAALVAALAGVVVIGTLVVSRPGPAATTPPGTPAPSAGPTPAASSSVFLSYAWPEELPPGTYATPFNWTLPFQVAFTVPIGWESRDIEVIKGTGMSVSVQLVANTYADPCASAPQEVPTGPTVADLSAALHATVGIEAKAPVAAERSGFTGEALEYTATPCAGAEGRLWSHPTDLIPLVGHRGPPWWPVRAGTHTVEILDVNGTRLVIVATAGPGATRAQQDEVAQVLGSLRILAQPTARISGACPFVLTSPAAPAMRLGPPFRVALGMQAFDLNGIHPEPPTTGLPSAQVDFTVTDIDFGDPLLGGRRPTAGLIPPIDTLASGFGTLMPGSYAGLGDNTYVGSWVMDAPGTWWASFTVTAGCRHRIPIEVLAVPPA